MLVEIIWNVGQLERKMYIERLISVRVKQILQSIEALIPIVTGARFETKAFTNFNFYNRAKPIALN